MESEMTIDELRECAREYFKQVIGTIQTLPENEEGVFYNALVNDLESMSDEMDEQSFGYLKLKVIY
jgi:hypothetical protein